ncbi:hypothetical protein AB2L28_00885 [Kineococcus sp. TBRC 1896]|uniref:Uncharacterized protein n=1 Tax=Kineococcus mangrovi TaxID=1660183 RepID=A0ABV4HWJ7_9ACTN
MIPDPTTWTPDDWAVFDDWAGGWSRCIGRTSGGRRCLTRVATPGSYCHRHAHQAYQ